MLFVLYNTKQIRQAYISKHNSDKERKQVILLMITDGKEKWYYLFVKRLSALLKRITSKNALKKHENVCKDHDCCYVEMPDKDNNILKYNSGEKHMRVPFVMYVDMECHQ